MCSQVTWAAPFNRLYYHFLLCNFAYFGKLHKTLERYKSTENSINKTIIKPTAWSILLTIRLLNIENFLLKPRAIQFPPNLSKILYWDCSIYSQWTAQMISMAPLQCRNSKIVWLVKELKKIQLYILLLLIGIFLELPIKKYDAKCWMKSFVLRKIVSALNVFETFLMIT